MHCSQKLESALEEMKQPLLEQQLDGLEIDALSDRNEAAATISSLQAILAERDAKIAELEADVLSDRNEAAATISSLQAILAERDSKIAELVAASTLEAVHLRASLESVQSLVSEITRYESNQNEVIVQIGDTIEESEDTIEESELTALKKKVNKLEDDMEKCINDEELLEKTVKETIIGLNSYTSSILQSGLAFYLITNLPCKLGVLIGCMVLSFFLGLIIPFVNACGSLKAIKWKVLRATKCRRGLVEEANLILDDSGDSTNPQRNTERRFANMVNMEVVQVFMKGCGKKNLVAKGTMELIFWVIFTIFINLVLPVFVYNHTRHKGNANCF